MDGDMEISESLKLICVYYSFLHKDCILKDDLLEKLELQNM